MSSEVALLIFDPMKGTMARERWLGGNGTRDWVRILCEKPAHSVGGCETWRTTIAVARTVSEASYADGATPEEIDRLAAKYPEQYYWWIIEHTY